MYKKFDAHKAYFYGVYICLIVGGAGVFAVGAVEEMFNCWGDTDFANTLTLIFGGLIVMSLGYIAMELEMLRTQPSRKS